METKEIEVSKIIKQYTLTEDEYHNLINNNMEYGSRKTKEYIIFCLKYYKLKLNFGGTAKFVEDIIDFVTGNRNYIPNLYNKTFFEWLDEHR
jgi:hypothetical protein